MFAISLILSALAVHSSLAGQQVSRDFSINIVGGSPAAAGEFPYQVSLLSSGRHFCGGSIVSPTHVVTAAHCVQGSSASSLSIRAGHIYNSQPGSNAQTVRVSRIHVHPSYSSRTSNNDIAVLVLASSLSFNSYVNKIAVPSRGSTIGTATGYELVATGWGATRQGGSGSNQLLKVIVPVYDQNTCNQRYGGGITAQMICAGYEEGGKDTCQGDSGGPLATPSNPSTLIGVTSFGQGCAQRGYPGVYARVAALESFVRQYCTTC